MQKQEAEKHPSKLGPSRLGHVDYQLLPVVAVKIIGMMPPDTYIGQQYSSPQISQAAKHQVPGIRYKVPGTLQL